MRIAVVGDPAFVAPLVAAIGDSPAHELIAVVPSPTDGGGGAPILPPGTRRCRSWEELLTDRVLSAVIVADDSEESLAAARQFASAGKSLLLAPLVARAATFVYELSLQQAEQPVSLVPLTALHAHPLVQKLRRMLRSGELGRIQHIQLEESVVPASSGSNALLLSMDDLAVAFLDDLDLLRRLGGNFDQVTAIRSGDPQAGISLQTITLSGAGLPQAIWTATPATEPAWHLRVVADRGSVSITGDPWKGVLSFEARLGGAAPQIEQAGFALGDWLLAETAATALATTAPAGTASSDLATWDDFTRVVELFDAVERSIRRRRMIEIHFESQSERGQFKTYMTAAGCSLLTLTLGAIVVYLTAASLIELPAMVKKVLVGLIFLPLGLFLGLQGLIFLARPSGESKPEPSK